MRVIFAQIFVLHTWCFTCMTTCSSYSIQLLINASSLCCSKGGFDDNSPLSSVERFDPRLHRWEYVAELTTPRGGVGVATVMGRVFAVGGHNGNIYLNTVEAFEPRMNR